MLARFRTAVLASSLLLSASPAHAANGIWSTTIYLPNVTYPFSLITGPDGNLWFSDFPAVSGGTGYIVRLTPSGTTTYFPLPNFNGYGTAGGLGGSQPTMSIALTNAPAAIGAPRQLAFNWLTYSPATFAYGEFGLGVIDIDHPSQITEYAAGNPGDPLYSSRMTLEPFALSIASRSSPPEILSYAHTLPSSTSAQELVVAVPFPFLRYPSFTTYPISQTPYYFSPFSGLVAGADGNTWYQGSNAIGQIGPAGSREFPVAPYVQGLAASQTSLWASTISPAGAYQIAYTGAVEAFYPWPLLAFDLDLIATTPDALWSLSFNSNIGVVYFMRMASSGQWSAYAVPSPAGTVRPALTTLAAASDGTLWAGISNPRNPPSTLVSLRSNRILSARPLQLTLSSGQFAVVSVRETNYPPQIFTSSVPASCPLTVVSSRFPGTFVVTATSNTGYDCGVTFTDRDGISVWVPAVLPNSESVPRQMPQNLPRFPVSGRS
jgi:hypothetical protein